jgi:hypothetical protein
MAETITSGSSEIGGIVQRATKPRMPLGVRPEATAQAAGGDTVTFFYGGGRLLRSVRVHLIFWGTHWVSATPPTPSMGACTDAVQTILASDYMDALSQYGVLRGALGSVTVVAAPIGGSPADPPNPFSNDDVWQLVENLRVAGRIPTADIGSSADGLFVVVMPNGVGSNQAFVIGEHSYYWFGSQHTNVPFAWVTQNSLDEFSEIFSHELAEAVTDPEGTGWTSISACGPNHGGWCEIGDICEGNTARVNGVLVQRYWSMRDAQCVVPDDPKPHKDSKDSADTKQHKDTKDHKDHKELKDGAKEKDKDSGHKEIEHPPLAAGTPLVEQLRSVARQLADLAGSIESEGTQSSFIATDERPAVADV